MKSEEKQADSREYLQESSPKPSLQPVKKRRQLWLLILIPILIVFGVGIARYLGSRNKAQNAATSLPPAARVKLATVQSGIIEDSSDFIANLDSRQSITLQPQVQGQISQIYVRSGQTVAKGVAIMQIDARQQQAAVSSNQAAIAVAQAQLDNAEETLRSLQAQRASYVSALKLNQEQYKRYSYLAQQGAVSQDTRDQYVNQLATGQSNLSSTDAKIQAQRAAVFQAQKTINQAQANTRQQQVQLQYYTINAPFTGTLGDLIVKVGDYVSPSTQLTTITQNQKLQVQISAPLELGPKLKQGGLVELINEQNQIIGKGQIYFIAPNVNNSQSILVKAAIDNPNGLLRANQYVRARIVFSQHPGVLIPTVAVSPVAGQNFVYVAQKTQDSQGKTQLLAQQKLVKLGNITGNNYQVLSGLETGQQIVVSGIQNLKNGAAIIPE